jgi:hypothetical protein
MRFFQGRISVSGRCEARQYSLGSLASAGTILVKEVERLVDLRQATLDLAALMRPGILLQALNQPLFLRKQCCRRPRPNGCCERQYYRPDPRWRAKA